MKIAIDIDDTIVALALYLFTMYELPLPTGWHFWNYTNGKIDRGQLDQDIHTAWEQKRNKLKPLEQNQHLAVDKISTLGNTDFLTVWHPLEKQYWLEKHHMHNKVIGVSDGRDKAKLGYDVLIDDSPTNYAAFIKTGNACILYDRPWNQHIEAKYRIYSIHDAYDIISSLNIA